MKRRNLRLLAALGCVLGLGGCQWYYNTLPSPDDLMHAVPWFNAMITNPSVAPYERADVPRYTPEGTVPVTGGQKDWGAEWRVGTTTTADKLVNPTNGEATARGDTLFHIFCATCHGNAGAGDGPVGKKIFAPALLTPRARAYTDGYLYSMIRYGRGVMPRYGDKVTLQADRWAIVNYVRKLQAASPPQPAAQTQPSGGQPR